VQDSLQELAGRDLLIDWVVCDNLDVMKMSITLIVQGSEPPSLITELLGPFSYRELTLPN
jgi:hypothetical protein